MFTEINTKITVGDTYGKGVPNITLEDALFFGRPNFAGELDRFNDDRRKFTVLIPNDVADQLRAIGYMVKTKAPTPEELQQFPDRETISHLKVFLNFGFVKGHEGDPEYETGPNIHVIQGEQVEKLTAKTVPILDRSRFESMDMELRGWEYNAEEQPGMYSARLVSMVVTLRPSILDQKYGRL